jgi:hypothetical protein
MSSSFIEEFAGYLAVKPLETRTSSEPVMMRCFMRQAAELAWTFTPLQVSRQSDRQYLAFWNSQYAAIHKNNPTYEGDKFVPAKEH